MPAIHLDQTTSPLVFPTWALYAIIAITIFSTSAFLASRLLSRHRLRSRAVRTSSNLRPFLLDSSLPLIVTARARPTVRKEFALVRGARLPRTFSTHSNSSLQSPRAIYTPDLCTPASTLRMSVPAAALPASAGLDTPPATPILSSPTQVEDVACQRAEASSEFTLTSSESTAISLCSSSSTTSSYSITSLLDAFPAPPGYMQTAQTSATVGELLPTPPSSPLECMAEFVAPATPSTSLEEDTALMSSAVSDCSMSSSDSDALVLGRLFSSSYRSDSVIDEMVFYEMPECPSLQDAAVYEVPAAASSMPASASFWVSIQYAFGGDDLQPSDTAFSSLSSLGSSSVIVDILELFPMPPSFPGTVQLKEVIPTPPCAIEIQAEIAVPCAAENAALLSPTAASHSLSSSDSDVLLLGRLFPASYSSGPAIDEMAPFEMPEYPPLEPFAAYTASIVVVSPPPTSTSFYAAIEYAADGGSLGSSDSSGSGSLYSYSSCGSSYSLTPILNAFPVPPICPESAQPSDPVEERYQTPLTNPSVPVTESLDGGTLSFHDSLGHSPMRRDEWYRALWKSTEASSAKFEQDTGRLELVGSSRSLSSISSDDLALGRLFTSSSISTTAIRELTYFEDPKRPSLQDVACYKTSIASPHLPAATSYCASLRYAAEEGHLTSQSCTSSFWS